MIRLQLIERELAIAVLGAGGIVPRDRVEALTKRHVRVLGRWLDEGWWEFGESLRMGKLTQQGREVLEQSRGR